MNNEPMLEVVVFTLASERYAIESVYVREVHPVRDLTPLPCTPPFLAGVMNVRGDILAVYDLGILFGLAEPPVESLNQVIVVDYSNLSFGILADASTETATLSTGDLEPFHPPRGDHPGPPAKGMTRDRLMVLDVPGMAGDERLVIHDGVAARHPDTELSEEKGGEA